eukprot:gnl/MRDRNA2_/MRDRNA2_106337_c0_seq1.p1 gnl/MRDRNA2_/MRDRNA2_106337_c0~~gnl/MRDRNA2_/MRDRNA2_106337_c0_seq1.p1  ORF type:complete len:406 (-),score=104.19 gnl/MRDRNA2_/MRDRNA2_106337_c0_seq1:200-1417(-)
MATAATGESIVSFGKHAGKTYQQLFDEEPGYCQWALKQDTPSGGLAVLQQFLKTARTSTGSISSRRNEPLLLHDEPSYNQWGYEGFDEWKDRFISGGMENWGPGNCWEYCEGGFCGADIGDYEMFMGGDCRGHHPKLQLSCTNGTGGTHAEIVSGNFVPLWGRALEKLGFSRGITATRMFWSHPTMPVGSAKEALRQKQVHHIKFKDHKTKQEVNRYDDDKANTKKQVYEDNMLKTHGEHWKKVEEDRRKAAQEEEARLHAYYDEMILEDVFSMMEVRDMEGDDYCLDAYGREECLAHADDWSWYSGDEDDEDIGEASAEDENEKQPKQLPKIKSHQKRERTPAPSKQVPFAMKKTSKPKSTTSSKSKAAMKVMKKVGIKAAAAKVMQRGPVRAAKSHRKKIKKF